LDIEAFRKRKLTARGSMNTPVMKTGTKKWNTLGFEIKVNSVEASLGGFAS
jgi:hypothetical protein